MLMIALQRSIQVVGGAVFRCWHDSPERRRTALAMSVVTRLGATSVALLACSKKA